MDNVNFILLDNVQNGMLDVVELQHGAFWLLPLSCYRMLFFIFLLFTCMHKFKIEILVTVAILHWHTNINAKFCSSSQIINEEKEGDGSPHEGTR